MKKIAFMFVPVIMLLCLMTVVPKILSSGMNTSTVILIAIMALILMTVFRPKKAATKTAEAVAEEFLDDYCANAFADDDALKAKFYAALDDYGKNMPKAAIAKLEKLAPLCTGSKEKYAVAIASAKTYFLLEKYKDSLREYNKALVLHPSSELSAQIGMAYQRQGNNQKAIEAYEFATELDSRNVDAWSRLAAVHVAEWHWETALDYAQEALELEQTNASALATSAICYGMLDDALMHNHYTRLAVQNGYSEDKIKETVKTLKKRSRNQ